MSYSTKELDQIRKSCQLTASIRDLVISKVVVGMTTKDVDEIAKKEIQHSGGSSIFYGYRGFPSHICISVNDVIVHGFSSDYKIKNGDLLSLDFGVKYKGFIGDTARTFCVGSFKEEAHEKLLDTTKKSLYDGISAAIAGNYTSDIGKAVENTVVNNGFSVVKAFVGHGVGRKLHEPPQVYNYDPGFKGDKLKVGMVIAIEPMVNIGSEKAKLTSDGWTAKTVDGSLSAHFEHTVLITDGEPEILTATKIFGKTV